MWDVYPAGYTTLLWRLGEFHAQEPTSFFQIQPLLGAWDQYRDDFHQCEGLPTFAFRLHQQSQQDANRLTWAGIVARTDGGVRWQDERMGAGYVAILRDGEKVFWFGRVGGPADGLPIAHSVSRCSEAEYRTWVKVLSGTYPVQEYLHRIKKASSPTCPHCTTGDKETLTHFVSCCPRFHDARTLAHNKVRAMFSTSLSRYIPSGWKLREETPMAATSLTLHPVPTACVLAAGRTLPVDAGEVMSLGRWQPDLIAISHQRRKIALIDLSRPCAVFPAEMIVCIVQSIGPI